MAGSVPLAVSSLIENRDNGYNRIKQLTRELRSAMNIREKIRNSLPVVKLN